MYPPKFGNLWLKILHPYARGCRHLILTFDIPHRAIWIYILENLIAWELVDFVYDLCQSRIHNSFLLHLARLTLVIKCNHRTPNMEVPIPKCCQTKTVVFLGVAFISWTEMHYIQYSNHCRQHFFAVQFPSAQLLLDYSPHFLHCRSKA